MSRAKSSSSNRGAENKLVPAVYKDALAPAAREVGHTLAGVVRVALSPANLFVWSYERACEFAASRIEQIFEHRHVLPEQVIQPPVEISGPIVSQLRLQNQAEALRTLYLNLLATAMTRRTGNDAHPAFVEIIRQLTPDEAKVIVLFTEVEASGAPRDFPFINVVAHLQEGGFEQILTRFAWLGSLEGCSSTLPTTSVDNLSRLGLISIRHDQRVADPAAYEPLEQHPIAREAIDLAGCRAGAHAEIERGLIEVTEFGHRFAIACTGEISCIGINPRERAQEPG